MFFFGPQKDRNYFLAQKLFGILAEAAPDGLKEKIALQKDSMKKAKTDNEYSLHPGMGEGQGRGCLFERAVPYLR